MRKQFYGTFEETLQFNQAFVAQRATRVVERQQKHAVKILIATLLDKSSASARHLAAGA